VQQLDASVRHLVDVWTDNFPAGSAPISRAIVVGHVIVAEIVDQYENCARLRLYAQLVGTHRLEGHQAAKHRTRSSQQQQRSHNTPAS
jgi:hypothetical protein